MKADKEKLGKRALRSKKKNFASGLKALISSVVGAGSAESEEEKRRVAEEVDNLCDQILMTHFYYNGSKDADEAPAQAKKTSVKKQPKAASSVPKPPPLPSKKATTAPAPRARPQVSFLQDIKNLQNAQRVQVTKKKAGKANAKPMGTPTRPNFLSEISGSARKLRKTPLPRSPGGTPARQKPRRSSAMASALEVAIAKRFSKIQVDSPMSDVSDFE